MRIHHLTWQDFDNAVTYLADVLAPKKELECVYGNPRGGLPLAVALSHHLKLELLTGLPCPAGYAHSSLTRKMLWCDDIIDLGRSLTVAAPWIGQAAVLVAARDVSLPIFAHAAARVDRGTWVVFPWEVTPSPQEVEAERSRLNSRGAVTG